MNRISRPASRLLAFLELLQSRPVVDGRAAATDLGVTERTIRRYAVALHDIGIPVDGQPGVGGGYRLRAGTRLPPLMLSDDEATAVAFGLVVAERRGIAAGDALAKITRVLPERLARRIERLRDEVSLLGEPDSAPPAASETLLVVAEAVRRRRSLEIDYTRGDGGRSSRVIDPFGLVARRGRWYVPARDHSRGELRTFRADRIGRAAIGEPAAPPEAGFDPGAHVVRMLARLPYEWRIEVLVDAPAEDVARRIPRTVAELSDEGPVTRVEMGADSLEWAAGYLARLGADFTVVRPDELRAHLGELGARLARAAGEARGQGTG
ncbi:MAG TPA: YafY family protein [Gaiellaceae bacterium]|nr:YafY family protein [Gaiellaceae bacterium]